MDASYTQWSTVQTLGPATVVPRHPTWLAYDVGTYAEQVDRFFANNTWVDPTLPKTWSSFVDIASNSILQSVLSNDPRPYYAHQNNLAEDGTFYPVADAFLAKFHAWYAVDLLQPTMTQAAAQLTQAKTWQTALTSGAVSAFVQDGVIHIGSTQALSVPLGL